MLKIKDNIDLKELEKYRFKKWDRKHFCKKYSYIYDCNGKSTIRIVVHIDKTLSITNANRDTINILYDLIKADLVEKVGD